MKKLVSALALVAMALSATPALAQSANDYMRYDQARDPGYQSAVRGSRYRNYYGYGGSYSYYPGVVPCFLFTCLLGGGQRRHHVGDVCYDANGVMYGLDRDRRWYRVPGSEPVRMDPNAAQTRCDWSGTSYGAQK